MPKKKLEKIDAVARATAYADKIILLTAKKGTAKKNSELEMYLGALHLLLLGFPAIKEQNPRAHQILTTIDNSLLEKVDLDRLLRKH